MRYDYTGPFSEKNGDLFNFDPSLYSATDSAVTNTGFIVAGNNKQYGTSGVSDSTLKGRQWGIAQRLGVAWAPKAFGGKLVWRAGAGLYYDRGEYFQYLSPPRQVPDQRTVRRNAGGPVRRVYERQWNSEQSLHELCVTHHPVQFSCVDADSGFH